MKLRFVSSFSHEGYTLYGKRFVESFLTHMPDESELLIYTEADPEPWKFPEDSRLKLLNLKELPSFDVLHTIYNSLAIFKSDYRYQVGRTYPKVWALIGASFEYDGILVWVDADTEWSAALSPGFIEFCLNGQDIAVMNRNRWHLCSSFMVIDCLTQGAQTFLRTLADMYGQGTVLLLAEWHDAFVIQSILQGMQARGEMAVSNTTDTLKLPCPSGPHNIFDDVFKGIARHHKGGLKRQVHEKEEYLKKEMFHVERSAKDRYVQLSELAASLKPRTFLEFGTWTGDRAIEVARASPGLDYVGIDLFETATSADDERELNVKSQIGARAVAARLAEHKGTIRNAVLFVGNSTRLDPEFVTQYTGWAELIFIDGGHSLATIESDLRHAFMFRAPGGVIVMDDYYSETGQGFTDKWGCNRILEASGVDYEVLPIRDPLKQGGTVQMVLVRGEPGALTGAHFSHAYIGGQRAMHQAYPSYGRTAKKWGARACTLIERYQPETILDYGCGKGELKGQLTTEYRRLMVREYDPGVPGKQTSPEPAELVFCIDVLEHIEPEYLDNVLKHIRSLTTRAAFFTIATREARKTLPDGRNSHLILKSAREWEDLLSSYFNHIIERAQDVTEAGEVMLLCEV